MKYKVGDKVKINSLVWYNKNRNECSSVVQNGISFTYSMSEYCGKTSIITAESNGHYILSIDSSRWFWYDWMLEDIESIDMTTIEKVEQWVIDRNLHTQDPEVQMCKTMEELGELARAIYKGDKEKQMDGIGDTVVTLICIAEQLGLKFNDCLDYAYNEIKDRKGKLINGTFVKESDL